MSDVERWLVPRLRGVPDSLRKRILAAVREAGNGKRETSDPSEALGAAADRLLREALGAAPTRDHAMTLLAADALMTYAMEAEAHRDRPTGREE